MKLQLWAYMKHMQLQGGILCKVNRQRKSGKIIVNVLKCTVNISVE